MATAADYRDPETGELTPTAIELIKRAAGLGSSMEQIGLLLGFTAYGWNTFRRQHPEIAEYIDEGKAHAELVISNSLYTKAKNGDVNAIRWYEMTRARRAEQIEQTGTVQYVIRGPEPIPEDKWIEQFSPPALEHVADGTGG